MELDEAGATNDFLRCNQTITYGGTLNLVNLGGHYLPVRVSNYLTPRVISLVQQYQPATPGAAQAWDLTGLNNGVVKVAGTTGPKLNFGVTNGVMR